MLEETPNCEILTEVDNDGLVVGLYHYLWLKNGKGHACSDISVPHTVIFQEGRPRVWFFTSGKDKVIKRKHKNNLNNLNILEAMASGEEPALGVCASFQGAMHLPSGKPKAAAKRRKAGHMDIEDEVMDWLDVGGLRELLPPGQTITRGGPSMYEGVLQKFILPRGDFNFTIKATWSPSACVLERRTNKTRWVDPRVPVQQRLFTWEGPTWLSDHVQLTSGVLSDKICLMCDSVAAHLKDVTNSGVVVARMELHFKVDGNSRVWLTHATSLRLDAQFLPRPPRSVDRRTARASSMIKLTAPAAVHEENDLGSRGCHEASETGTTGSCEDGPSCMRTHNFARMDVMSGRSQAIGVVGLDLEPRTLKAYVPTPSQGGSGGLNAALLSSFSHQQRSMSPESPHRADSGSRVSPGGNGTEAGSGDSTFIDVMNGETYPISQRCEVTYKLLLQHWFTATSQLPSESERLQAMDDIPKAIRRAYPALTRDWYLRVRSQPSFLYRTAHVSAESARKLTHAAIDDLQKSMGGGNGVQRRHTAQGGSAPATPTSYSKAGMSGPPRTPASQQAEHNAAIATALMPRSAGMAKTRPRTRPGMRGQGMGMGMRTSPEQQQQRHNRLHHTQSARGEHPGGGYYGASGGGHGREAQEGPSRSAARPSLMRSSSIGATAGNARATHSPGMSPGVGKPALRRQDSDLSDVSVHGSSMAVASRRTSISNSVLGLTSLPGSLTTLPTMLLPKGSPAAGYGQMQQQGSGIMSAYLPGNAANIPHGVADMPPPPSAVVQSGQAPMRQRNLAAVYSPPRDRPTGSSADIAGGSDPGQPGASSSSPVPAGAASRSSPPRSPGALASAYGSAPLHTILEAEDSAPQQQLRAGTYVPPHLMVLGSAPNSRPSTRGGNGGAAGGSISPGRGGVHSSYVARRQLSESGDFGGGPASMECFTPNSTIGSVGSRRSARTALTPDDMVTLRDLSDAYAQAEMLTQHLLAQAKDLLTEATPNHVSGGIHSRSRSGTQAAAAATAGGGAGGYASGAGGSAGSSPANSRPSSRHSIAMATSSTAAANGKAAASSSSSSSAGEARSKSRQRGTAMAAVGPSPLRQQSASQQALGPSGTSLAAGMMDGSSQGLSGGTARGHHMARTYFPMDAAQLVAGGGGGGGQGVGVRWAGGVEEQPPSAAMSLPMERSDLLMTSAEHALLSEALAAEMRTAQF